MAATEKYLNGTGLAHVWSTIKSTFLFVNDEDDVPIDFEEIFATIDDTNIYACGNNFSEMRPGSRKIIPLQAPNGFNGSVGEFVYESYLSGSSRYHRNKFQLRGTGTYKRLYTIPTSGSPAVVTTFTGSGVTSSTGFYVVQDTMHGNWWLNTTADPVTPANLGIS